MKRANPRNVHSPRNKEDIENMKRTMINNEVESII